MFKVNNKKHQNDVTDVVLVFSLLTLNIFHTFLQCFCCYFEQVNISWETIERSTYDIKLASDANEVSSYLLIFCNGNQLSVGHSFGTMQDVSRSEPKSAVVDIWIFRATTQNGSQTIEKSMNYKTAGSRSMK